MQKRNFIKRVGVFLLLNILWCGSFCSHVLAQDVDNMMVTVMMKQGTLKSFFDEVSKQTGLQFVYEADVLEQADRVTIDAANQPVRAVLGQVLNQVSCA